MDLKPFSCSSVAFGVPDCQRHELVCRRGGMAPNAPTEMKTCMEQNETGLLVTFATIFVASGPICGWTMQDNMTIEHSTDMRMRVARFRTKRKLSVAWGHGCGGSV